MMNTIKLTNACNIVTGKLDSNAAVPDGHYPFFTCAPDPLKIDSFAFDGPAILLAGNNAAGNFHCQRYDGKFNAYQRTYVITAKQGYDIDFIYYSLLINLQLFRKIAQGSQTKFLTMEILDGFEFDNLPYIKQIVLAKVLKNIDLKIANNNAICADLEAMAKLLYDYWFVQFDFPDENGKPYKSSGGKMVWNEDLKREIPEGWKVGRVGDMISTERGISYSTPNIATGQGVPMLNLATFMPGGGDYKADGLKHFLGDYPQNKVLKPYELIMCNTQQTAIKFETDIIGRAMLVPDIFDGDVVFSHHVNVIRTLNEDMKYYLLYLFNSDYYHKYISGFTNGTNILGLSFNGVEDYLTEVPDEGILKMFGEWIHGFEKKKSQVLLENEQLASLRDFLLPMLMNGQVKVGGKGDLPPVVYPTDEARDEYMVAAEPQKAYDAEGKGV